MKKIQYLLLIFILIVIVFLIGKDLFLGSLNKPDKNPYEFSIDEYHDPENAVVKYSEVQSFKVDVNLPSALALYNQTLFVGGDKKVILYNISGQKLKEIEVSGQVHCLFADKNKLYVGYNNTVELISISGENLLNKAKFHESSYLTSIVALYNSIFIADAGQKLVYKCNADCTINDTINGITESEENAKGFIVPSPYFDLAVGSDSTLWITNPGIHQLMNYDAHCRFKSSWKKTAMSVEGFSGCCNPIQIAILNDGSFITAEKGLVRVKIHKPDGSYKHSVVSPKAFSASTVISDLLVNINENIILIDKENNSIRKFVYEPK